MSQQRQARVMSRFETITSSLESAKQSFAPFVRNADSDGQYVARATDAAIADIESLNLALAAD